MRLLVVSQYFWPEPFRVNDLVEDLVARGHEVTVLTGLPNYPEGQIYPGFADAPETFAEHAGAPIIRVPILSRGKGNFRLGLNYLSFVLSGLVLGTWRLRGRAFDAIFVFQTSPITAALPALWLRSLKRAPTLMWVLDLWPESLAAVGVLKSPWLLTWVGRLVSFIYRRCDRILVQSRAFIENIVEHGAPPDRIRYFPGWPESVFQGLADSQEVAPELAPYANDFKILFAGNVGEAQGFPAILDAIEALDDMPRVRWLILGGGRALDQVRDDIHTRGLEGRVSLLGRYPIDHMPSFFRGADALLVSLKKHPTFGLTIPGKVQAYLAAGVPILGILDGEGARIIEESGAGLVVPAGDGWALAACARTLASLSPETRRAMGERGRNYCRMEFDRTTLISTLEDEIMACVAGTPVP